MEKDIAIGIDLGTTNCCVAVYYNEKVIIIPNHLVENSNTTPSYVAFNKDESCIVGHSAKEKAYRNLESTIYDAKRIIGRDFKDPLLQHDMTFWPFKVKEEDSTPKIEIHGKSYYPEQISAKLLSEMRDIAEAHFQLKSGTIKKAVITVPAYFNDGQRQATMDAAKLAGLDVLSVLNEPTAAAIAYYHQRLKNIAKKVLIFDLGGGTLDVAVIEILSNSITVLGIHGDSHLGGQDFDQNVMLYCVEKFKEDTKIDLLDGKDSPTKKKRDEVLKNLRRLQVACENCKKRLSGKARSADVDIEGIVNGEDLCVEISQQKFEEVNAQLFQKCVKVLDDALSGSKVEKGQIDDIILIGGSTRMNKIRYLLEAYFEKKKLNVSINPDEAVAYGAAIHAAILNGGGGSKLALTEIQDVTGMSLGTRDGLNGHFIVFIPKNTKIPTRKWKTLNAVSDDQDSVLVRVYQGEDDVADKNKFLGEFCLSSNIPVKKLEPMCDVVMEINKNGILHVTALSTDSKNKSELTVVADKHRMSEATIEKLLTEMKV